ncbi:MAG: response regulator [Herbaspirillum sp.]
MMADTALPRILCVDDEPNILAAMERSLFGTFEVEVAGDGERAIDTLQHHAPFAVILSDMRMPGMDGTTFLSRARELAPSSVRILLTGEADLRMTLDAARQGVIFGYLSKPCPRQMLLATLGKALAHYRRARGGTAACA